MFKSRLYEIIIFLKIVPENEFYSLLSLNLLENEFIFLYECLFHYKITKKDRIYQYSITISNLFNKTQIK